MASRGRLHRLQNSYLIYYRSERFPCEFLNVTHIRLFQGCLDTNIWSSQIQLESLSFAVLVRVHPIQDHTFFYAYARALLAELLAGKTLQLGKTILSIYGWKVNNRAVRAADVLHPEIPCIHLLKGLWITCRLEGHIFIRALSHRVTHDSEDDLN